MISASRGTISAAFDLLADAVLHPAFADAEVERVRKRRLGELIQSKEDPSAVADRVTLLALNTQENPYGYPVLGSEAGIKAVTAADLRGFWEKQAVPRNAAIIVSGDFTKEELQTLLDNHSKIGRQTCRGHRGQSRGLYAEYCSRGFTRSGAIGAQSGDAGSHAFFAGLRAIAGHE